MIYRDRINAINTNNQGCVMKITKYINANNVEVMFLNDYKYKKNSTWANFITGRINNPYYPNVYGIGMGGHKYNKQEHTKEYCSWRDMLYRQTEYFKNNNDTYKLCVVCKEWHIFDNFYEWLIDQENYQKWLNGDKWCLDKDILVKNNKIYSPETCCLVLTNVNTLFVKKDKNRGDLPIGVTKNHKRYMALCSNPYTKNNHEYLGTYDTPIEAFIAYKTYKEDLIKKIAKDEYTQGNIIKKVYEVMLNYTIDIND